MKIVCKKNILQGQELKEATDVFDNKHEYVMVSLGVEYLVLGIAISQKNCLYYLIDEGDSPNWLPYSLFDISDNRLPNNWYVKTYGRDRENSVYLLVGFEELVNNDNFLDLLIERDATAVEIYFKRKSEMLEELF
jgi:hypothetical protein